MKDIFALLFLKICITASYGKVDDYVIIAESDKSTEVGEQKRPIEVYGALELRSPSRITTRPVMDRLEPRPPIGDVDYSESGSGVGYSSGDSEETCTMFQQECSLYSYCTDYSNGYCCHCHFGFYGNGWHCLSEGVPQRVNGKVRGMVAVGNSPVELADVDLHAYMVVRDGRAFATFSRVPELAGRALMPLTPIADLFGWLYALETPGHQNGFSITGAEFTCHMELVFNPGNQRLSIVQEATGLNQHNYLRVDTSVHGDLPFVAPDATVQIEPYRETFQYRPSVLTATSVRKYIVVSADGVLEHLSFLIRRNVTYRHCPHGPPVDPVAQQHSVERVTVMYETQEQTMRYASASTVGPVAVNTAEPRPVNPCFDGSHGCHSEAFCLPGEGAVFDCQCDVGYWGDGYACHDVDECTEGLSTCSALAQCVNVPGGHLCLCRRGYQTDPNGWSCSDIDECQLHLCHPHASCINIPGSFLCQCSPGFHGDGFQCLPPRVHFERPLTECELHRAAALGGPGPWGEGPLEWGPYVPQCDEYGGYQPLQCHGATGHCWCVDSRGQERAGSRTIRGTPPITCDHPAPFRLLPKTVCEGWRSAILDQNGGLAVSSDYVPQCDDLGQFKPVQCDRDGSPCWCVDGDGREVVGTRSHDIVKPACIPTVAPPTMQLVPPRPNMAPPLSEPILLFSRGQQIGAVPLSGPHMETEKASVLHSLQGSVVVGIDYDCREKMVYWTDLASQTISRARLNPLGEPEVIVNTGLTSPEGLSVDALHRKLFWVDSGKDRIETSGLDGRARRVLIDGDLQNPRAIVVDPISGTLYWSDWSRDFPKIERSSVNGQNRRVLVHNGIRLPNALTFDPSKKHLCWADAGTKRLECISPDGTGRREIQNGLSYPFSLASHSNHFFYSDWNREGILVLNEDGSWIPNEYRSDQKSHLYGITVTSPVCSSGF